MHFAFAAVASACPFCPAVTPTISQRIEAADAAYLAECVKPLEGRGEFEFEITRAIKSQESINEEAPLTVPGITSIKPGALALISISASVDRTKTSDDFVAIPLTETGFAYIAKLPPPRSPAADRLRYFAKFLEHADPLLAEDAFGEFAWADYADVAAAADAFSPAKLRHWFADDAIAANRKGFYALALGLTARGEEREANLNVLKNAITAEAKPGSDFRAGFDGVLGAYLVADAAAARKLFQKQFVAPAEVPSGDLHHLLRALRFYHEFGPAAERNATADFVAQLIDKPEVAALAIIDLTRWERWHHVAEIAALYHRPGYSDRQTRAAIVGYLANNPSEAARAAVKAWE